VLLSVVIPTHRPDGARLRRSLAGLRAQSLPVSDWETVLVDNASVPPVELATFADDAPTNLRLVTEPALGLTAARRRGFVEAHGELLVLVDDDNVLAPDYLERVVAIFTAHPTLGAIGGRSAPEFAAPPAPWQREFFDLLALRDLGPEPLFAAGLRPPGSARNVYPACAPIGAGLALRRAVAVTWLATSPTLSDRRGTDLTSGGVNDIVFTALHAGWGVGYFPTLALTHLIPAGRLDPAYLARLNRGIQQSWMQVLTLHGANDWPPIPRWTVPLRQLKAWFTHRAWSSPAARIRWQGACGHFEGRVQP
jgi:glycosyltransferase involved in cell wall biosynthesis